MIRQAGAVLVALALSSPLAAQQLVPVGVRVRVRLPESRAQVETRANPVLVIRGEVTAESAESLWVRPTRVSGVIGISKAGIRTLAVSRGEPRRIRSLLVEGIGGAIIGGIEAFIIHNVILHDGFGDTQWDAMKVGASIGGGAFAIIGFLWPVEYWRRVRL